MEYADEPGTLYYFRYPVAPLEDEDETELFLEVATSRPETILGDTAVAVNPTDERFQALIGRECVVPFTDPPRRIPIIGDEYVDVEFGTGALKVTPGHDPNDYEIGQRVGLETINIMNKDGTMNGVCGEAYESLDRFECRTKLWRDMESERFGDQDGAVSDARASIAAGRRDHRASRIRAVVLQDGHHGGAGTRGVESGELAIVPPRFEKIYRGWLGDIRDWCISRQLWWGHRIPVWYVHESAEALARAALGRARKGSSPHYVVARDEAEACSRSARGWRRVDSFRLGVRAVPGGGRAGHVVLVRAVAVQHPGVAGRGRRGPRAKFFPTAVMETGHDILFFWVARMVMLSYGMTGKAAVPHGVPARPRPRREGAQDVEVARERRGPARV